MTARRKLSGRAWFYAQGQRHEALRLSWADPAFKALRTSWPLWALEAFVSGYGDQRWPKAVPVGKNPCLIICDEITRVLDELVK